MMDIFETIKKVAGVHSPSGFEDKVADVLAEMAAPYADEVYKDVMGNLICLKKGKEGGKKVMVCAHMDSIGFIVTHIEDNGFVRFARLGGIGPTSVIGTPVIFENGTRGRVCKEDKADIKELKLSSMYIDIGASSKEEALKYVKIADTAVYATEAYRVGENGIISPYMDDRICCVAEMMALQSIKESENDIYFVFSVQEEVGGKGATTSAYAIEPYVGLAIDVTRTGDVPAAAFKMDCDLGKGAAVKVIDSSLICSPKVVDALIKCAEANDITYQIEDLEAGGTDASAIQKSRSGAYAGGISIPTRYIHSPAEMVDERDVKATAALIAAFCAGKIEF